MITETNIDALKSRIIKGLIYCNSIQQQIRKSPDDLAVIDPLIEKREAGRKLLDELAFALTVQGYNGCVFGECRHTDDTFCLVCTKG